MNVLSHDQSGNTGTNLNTSSLTIANNPRFGTATVNNDGTISYVPNAGFVGKDSLVYNICDNSSPNPICNTAVVYFTIEPVNATNKTIALDDYANITNTPNGGVTVRSQSDGGAKRSQSGGGATRSQSWRARRFFLPPPP